MAAHQSESKHLTILRDAIKTLSIAVVVAALIVVVNSVFGNLSHTVNAEDNDSTLAYLIQELANEEVTIFLEFDTPVAGQNAWFIPEDLSVDEQFAGRRLLGEIGEDYICIEEIGVGLQTTYCVPYSNIAYVSFNPPAN